MLHVPKDFPGMKQVVLHQNYRCSGEIVEKSQNVIRWNDQRFEKELRTDNAQGKPIEIRTFENESEEYPGFIPGNVIFEIVVKEDRRIKRKGNDLYITQDISLLNSLTGGVVQIEYLDRKLSTEIKEVIPSGTIKRIIGKGMPFFNDNKKYGDLIVQFNVIFPKKIDDNQSRMIQIALGGKGTYQIKQKENINTFNLSNMKRTSLSHIETEKKHFVVLSEYNENEVHSSYY